MSWQKVLQQIEVFSHLLSHRSIDINRYTEHPRNLVSLSKNLNELEQYEQISHPFLEMPTSGESSPCLSESGKTKRAIAPSVLDIQSIIDEEVICDVNYNLEGINESTEKQLNLLVEGLDLSITKERFLSLMNEVKIYQYGNFDIFDTRKSRFIDYQNKRCFVLKILLKKPSLFAKYMRKLQMHLKKSLGYGVGMNISKMKKKEISHLNGVVLRNLPPKITQEDLKKHCIEEAERISFGPIEQIKSANCCFVECEYLEDAEVICKRIHKMQVKDPEKQEYYRIKAHIFPENTLKHRNKTTCLFSGLLRKPCVIKSQQPRRVNKSKPKRTEISRLIEIFANPGESCENSQDFGRNEYFSQSSIVNFSDEVSHDQFQDYKNKLYITSHN